MIFPTTRAMGAAILPALLFLGLGCSSIRVQTDYEPGRDWSSYNTYNFYPDMAPGLGEFDNRRLMDALETVLRQRGYLQSEEPDFLIDVTSEIYPRPSGSNVGFGVGGTGRTMGGGVSLGIPVNGRGMNRQITFNLIDTSQESLVWQGVSTDAYREGGDPLEREQQLLRVVEKVFSRFPPR